MSKIKFELSDKPSKAEKESIGKSGFVPVKARWVILGGKMQNSSQEL